MNQPVDAHLVVDETPATLRRLRVAVVTETFPPEVNGVARTISRVVDGLRARGHDVQLIRPRQVVDAGRELQASEEQVLTRGLPIPGYPDMRMGLPSKRALMSLWKLRRPDVVYVATEGPLGWSALQTARSLRVPVASEFRTNFHAYAQHYGVGWLQRPMLAYLRKFHNRTHVTMVPTAGLKKDLSPHGFERLEVVQRGVDTDLFHPGQRREDLRQSWGAAPDDPVVVCVGRLAAEKNLMLLAEAFEAFRAGVPRARLVVVGDGPLREQLQARAPYAHFAGSRSGDDLAAHYASADLFFFPSVTETFGNVTLEAMASGLPVLAYNYAAAAQVIDHGHNGWLVPFDDAAAYVQTAAKLHSASSDWKALGTLAVQAAARNAWDSIISQIERVLRQVLSDANAKSVRP
jgi:glycosyltransferase involved in cell wall biosynthesis